MINHLVSLNSQNLGLKLPKFFFNLVFLVLDHKLLGLLDKSPVDYDVKQLDVDFLDSTMNELKDSKVNNYFVLAKITNIDRVLEKVGITI